MEIINPRPKMVPFIRHMLVIPDPIDFEKHKRVKRIMALTEKHKFKKTFLDERALSSSRFYPKKQARELSIGFNMHHNNIKTINRFLKRQPSLNRLSLTFSHKLNDAGWVNIGKSLARFPHLNKLSIHFERTIQKIKDETLDKLRRHLKKLPKLDDVVVKCGTDQPLIFTLNLLHLGLSFTGGLVSISNNFLMDKIIQQTRQFLKLTTIKLDPVMNASITDNALQDLGLALLKLKNLEKVSFNFQKCTAVTLQGVGAFLDILSRAPKLRKIKLGLFLKEKIADTPLNHPLWKLRYFKKVSLDLMFASDCDSSVFDLTMAALQDVSSLYTFQLDLTDCHYVSDGTLENMAGVIKNLSRIQKLRLNFGECQKITDIGVSAIISSIMELRNLTKLFLDFSSCCTIPTANISRNWDGQFSGLKKLTHVSVLFNKCIGLSESLLTEVVNIITDCKQLEQLYLGLNRCEAVRDKTVRGIGKALRKLEQLTSLKLEFGKEQNLFDNMQRRAKRANHITKSLLEVDSDIITNAHIEDKGLIALGKSISRFKTLKDLTLDIKDCDNITQEGLQEFCRCFFNVYNLHKFVLNGNLDNPPRELWKIASELDEKLPHRYLFVMQFRRCSSGTERFARGI